MGIGMKFGQSGKLTSNVEPVSELPTRTPSERTQPIEVEVKPVQETQIAQGLVLKGAIAGGGALFVDGEVVGNINLPESRVTIGPNGAVSDGLSICINARDIVVLGRIRGNISASDLVEIHAKGWLTGNVTARRISIADGAFFKGEINLLAAKPYPMASNPDYVEEQGQAYA